MKKMIKRICLLCLIVILLCAEPCSIIAVAENRTVGVAGENILPEATKELLLEIPDLSATATNAETGASYTQAFGNSSFYKYNTETGNMNSLAVGGSGTAVTYGGKTNLPLGENAKYTVTYKATASALAAGGGLRISYASTSSSAGIYAASDGTKACLAYGNLSWNGYSGWKNYTSAMKTDGSIYSQNGFAQFDLEIDGYVIYCYVNDELLFQENIKEPSNASAAAGVVKNYVSDTLCLVWSEWTKANMTAGEVSAEIKDLKIYSGLLHEEEPPAGEEPPAEEEPPILPKATGELLLEVSDLSAKTANAKTGAAYSQAFGNDAAYAFNSQTGNMNFLAVGGSGTAVTYGGKTNLKLGDGAKYTVSYMATLSSLSSGSGLRISYASGTSSIGFYSITTGSCLAYGNVTSKGYTGYKNYTSAMKQDGSIYQNDGFAKFDIEINGYEISAYVNDVLLFRENIQAPSNKNAQANIAKDYVSETLCLVWGEWTKADMTVGEVSTEIKDLKIYSGLIHQEVYDLSMLDVQKTVAANGTTSVRFVAGGNTDTYDYVGLEIMAKVGTETLSFYYQTSTVVRKIKTTDADAAMGELTAEALDVSYLLGYLLTDIPADTDVEFTVRPYLRNSSGNSICGEAKTYRINEIPTA